MSRGRGWDRINLKDGFQAMNKWDAIRFISYLKIMKVIALAVVLALVFSANCWVTAGHELKDDASKAVKDGLKQELLSIIPTLSNTATAQALKADLEQSDQSKASLKEIDVATVSEIFNKLSLKNPNCDKDGNGKVSGDELKCLGKLWKYYLPK